MEGTLDFAAAHGGGYTLAKFRFADPEFLGQPHADFQKAMIDRLQFPGQQSLRELALASRKAGHATNHRGPRKSTGGSSKLLVGNDTTIGHNPPVNLLETPE